MYTLSDKSQFQARAIQEGRHKLAPGPQELVDWISKQFGVTALNFYCEKRPSPDVALAKSGHTSKGAQQVVHMILDTVEDVKKMQGHRADNAVIAERFLEYLKSTPMQDPLKSDVFSPDSYRDETNPYPEIIVTYRPLTALDGKIIQEMLNDEQRAFLKTFESYWNMSVTVVFYYTDAQVKENLANGTSAKINEGLAQLNEKYWFDPGSPYRFDSKEAFDRDYEGNWYYYWK